MIDLKNRVILDDGTVICSEAAAIEMLYNGLDLYNVNLDDEVITKEFNSANQLLDQGFEFINNSTGSVYENVDWYSIWLTPQEYQNINVQDYCLKRCTIQEQRDRVLLEIKLFEERNMIPVLRHIIWMVDHMRKNKIVWGVGRGSMTSSLILFLIGIHRINPLKFNLDIKEFLR